MSFDQSTYNRIGNTCTSLDACGWERYDHITIKYKNASFMHPSFDSFYYQERKCKGALGRLREDPERLMKMPPLPGEMNYKQGVYNYALYEGKLYYFNGTNTIYVCATARSDPSVLTIFREKKGTPLLCVNQYGVFLINVRNKTIEVDVWSLGGDVLCSIRIEAVVDSGRPYLCGSRLFLIAKEVPVFKAMVYDLDIKNGTAAGRVLYEGVRIKEKSPFINASYIPRFILGGPDYALVLVDYHFQYRSSPREEGIEGCMAAWHYISLTDGQRYCLSNLVHDPEQIKRQPEAYIRYLENPQNAVEWLRIAHFDLRNNVIWVYWDDQDRSEGKCGSLLPFDLRPVFLKYQREDFVIWRLNQKYEDLGTGMWGSDNGRRYFDGKSLFVSGSYFEFESLGSNGEIASWGGGHGNCDSFHVEGDTLFLDSDLTYHESILDLTEYVYYENRKMYCPKEIRINWCNDYTLLNKLIELYDSEKQKTGREKEIKTSDHQRNDDLVTSVHEVQKSGMSLRDRVQDHGSAEMASGIFGSRITNGTAEKKTSPQTQSDGKNSNVPGNLEYWQGFAEYLQGKVPSSVRIPKAADRNWFALRLGSSKVRIECSRSTRKQNLRVGFFMENTENVYGNAARHANEIESMLMTAAPPETQVRWDNTVADANVSLFIPSERLTIPEQYEIMKNVICKMTGIMPYLGL